MNGQRLILKDGTTIENGSAGYSDATLWLYCYVYTMMQAAMLFFDPAKTDVIVFQYGDMEDRYEGFTNCRNMMINEDGRVSVCLKRGD